LTHTTYFHPPITPSILLQMTSGLDTAVQAALADLDEGKYPSIRAAAAAYSLSSSTLARRRRNGLSRREAHSNQQILSPVQEDQLVQWILHLKRQGHTPTHHQVREMAQKISHIFGGPCLLGTNWIQRFLQRHTEVATKTGRSTNALRVQNTNPTDLRAWYDRFDGLLKQNKIHPSNIWNMEETQAAQTAQIAGQKPKIEKIQGAKRQKIPINAQEKFADIRTVKAAQDREMEAAEHREKYAERVGRAMARRTANEMMNKEIETFITTWQL
jgi:Tc5 transposase DNA-binding domain